MAATTPENIRLDFPTLTDGGVALSTNDISAAESTQPQDLEHLNYQIYVNKPGFGPGPLFTVNTGAFPGTYQVAYNHPDLISIQVVNKTEPITRDALNNYSISESELTFKPLEYDEAKVGDNCIVRFITLPLEVKSS